MRVGLWGLTAVFLGALAAHFLLQDRGYVMINFLGYVIEMSVPALLFALVAAYAGVRALVALWRAPRRLGKAVAERRVRRAGEKLTQGLIHIAEGDWSKGERLLAHGLRGTDAPLINYLMAARAAQLQGSDRRRDEWLKLAYEEMPEAEIAILLTQAELQLEHEEFERALATLSRIQEAHTNHPVALVLLAKIYQALEDWDHLIALLPQLGDARLDASELEGLSASALEGYSARSGITHDDLERVWAQLPPPLRKAPRLIALYAMALSMLGRGAEAEKEVRGALKRKWDENLVLTYGRIRGGGTEKQLRRTEEWLKVHAEDGALLLTAARLCMGLELWGKARSYLESSLSMFPRADAYALYGRLLNHFGEEDNAARAFQSGLGLMTSAAEELPVLDAPETLVGGDESKASGKPLKPSIEAESVVNPTTQ
jgi:HemY protein